MFARPESMLVGETEHCGFPAYNGTFYQILTQRSKYNFNCITMYKHGKVYFYIPTLGKDMNRIGERQAK